MDEDLGSYSISGKDINKSIRTGKGYQIHCLGCPRNAECSVVLDSKSTKTQAIEVFKACGWTFSGAKGWYCEDCRYGLLNPKYNNIIK